MIVREESLLVHWSSATENVVTGSLMLELLLLDGANVSSLVIQVSTAW